MTYFSSLSSSSIRSLVLRPLSSSVYLKALSFSFSCSSFGSMFSNSAKSKSSLIIYWSCYSLYWFIYYSSLSNSSINSYVFNPLFSRICLNLLSFSFSWSSNGSMFSSSARSKSYWSSVPWSLICINSFSSSSISSWVLSPLFSRTFLKLASLSFS